MLSVNPDDRNADVFPALLGKRRFPVKQYRIGREKGKETAGGSVLCCNFII